MHNRGWLTLRMSANGLSADLLEGSLALFQALARSVKAQQSGA